MLSRLILPNVYSYQYLENVRRLPVAERVLVEDMFNAAHLVSGHFQYGIHEIGNQHGFRYVTAVREPIARLLSQWNWWCSRDSGVTEIIESNLTLAEYIRGGGIYMLDNHQVRVLAGGQSGDIDERTPSNQLDVVDDAMLQRAKTNVANHFALVLSDKVQMSPEMLARIQKYFGIKQSHMDTSERSHPTNFESHRQIKSTELLDLSPQHPTRVAVEKLVEWDRKLYEWLHEKGGAVQSQLYATTRCSMDGSCRAHSS